MIRTLVLALSFPSASVAINGCAIPRNDTEREEVLIDEWRREGWPQDQPTDLTPYRTHGGVGPESSSIF